MLIGSQTDYFYELYSDDEKAIRHVAQAGFESIDLSIFCHKWHEGIWKLSDGDFDAYFAHLKDVATEAGVIIGQTHSPFPTWCDDDPKENEYRMWQQIRSIRATSILGSKYVVIHPCCTSKNKGAQSSDFMFEFNLKNYRALRPYLEKYSVSCAIENMFSFDRSIGKICPTVCSSAEEMALYIDALGTDCFCACLDVGHANLIHYDGYETVNPVDMVHILGDRLKVLHAHDNNGIIDEHIMPYRRGIDWNAFCGALKDIGYSGVFNLEADNELRKFPSALADDCARFMCSVAGLLADKAN